MAEENKVLVPPFSKKEVKIIAVEGVNEAINDGKINLPAGGTKLYKHTATCMRVFAEDSAPATFVMIMTIGESLAGKPINYYKYTEQFISGYWMDESQSEPPRCQLLGLVSGYDTYWYAFDENGSISSIEGVYGDNFLTDTVEEL